jgi:hypothetical protein
MNKNIYDIYPDFNWIIYKELNPYLYIIGLRTEEDYINNYLLDGQYKGRIYKESQIKNYSYHVLLATIGKITIFNILIMLKKQLLNKDFLTIVFDGIEKSTNIDLVRNFCNDFLCKVNIIVEDKNLGYWGHGIRNKHNNLEGDFIYHIDDDDILYEDTFDIIRKHCINTNIIYLFKITLENNTIVWKNEILKESEISTQSGVIPMNINKDGFWTLRYGGDFDFYNNLSKKYNIIFIDKLIYKKIGTKNRK